MSRDDAWVLLAQGNKEGVVRLWYTGRGYRTTEAGVDLRGSDRTAVLVAEVGPDDGDGMNIRDILDTLAEAESRHDALASAAGARA
jgi:hypothetical protein